jgi:hypothetical protein
MLEPQPQMLVEYLDAYDEVRAAEIALAKAKNIEAALAKTIFESFDNYPREVVLMVTVDRGIEIDDGGSAFEEYHWPDSPIKVRKLQEVSALNVPQLMAAGGYL